MRRKRLLLWGGGIASLLVFWLFYFIGTGHVISLFLALAPLGALMNVIACYHNKGVMPVYCPNETQWYCDDKKHVIKTDKSEIRCFYLCDIIHLPNGCISLGDTIGIVGVCVGLYWMVALCFMFAEGAI